MRCRRQSASRAFDAQLHGAPVGRRRAKEALGGAQHFSPFTHRPPPRLCRRGDAPAMGADLDYSLDILPAAAGAALRRALSRVRLNSLARCRVIIARSIPQLTYHQLQAAPAVCSVGRARGIL